MILRRQFDDWLSAYVEYSSFSEAPVHMRFWSGVSAIAGALRRRVWIEQGYFRWFPNFYIILVAPPGIVSKSTTASIALNLLRAVPGIKFGPDVVTWQALTQAFAEATEAFEWAGAWHPMSAMTIESSEFGNLLNPQDKEMVDLLVALWDGKQGTFEKRTKMSGNDVIENPWINVIACTTPAWIAGNFPEYMIGGGFTSRCLFVYAEEKAKFVAYPGLVLPPDFEIMQQRLIRDLEHISVNLCGPYKLSAEAIEWGESWYRTHYTSNHPGLDDARFGGYIARKQTHIHKLAMILAASKRDARVIEREDLSTADEMVTDLEREMPKVFAQIGRSGVSFNAQRLVDFVRKAKTRVSLNDAYNHVHANFPSAKEFNDVLSGLIQSGQLVMVQEAGRASLTARVPLDGEEPRPAAP